MTLIEGAPEQWFQSRRLPPLPLEDSFTALWRLTYLTVHDDFVNLPNALRLASLESVLKSLSTTESQFAYISHSIIALLKLKISKEFRYFRPRTVAEALSGLNHYIFPTETAISIPSEFHMQETEETWEEWTFYDLQRQRISEASFDIVAEYLEHCTTDILPYNAVKTLDSITYYLPPETAIHPTHQIRLANSVHSVFAAGRFEDSELLNEIINSSCWTLYAEGHKTEEQVRVHLEKANFGERRIWPWLDNPAARQKVKDAFTDYEKKLMLATDSDLPNTRLQTILQGIKSWHPESDSMCPNRDEEGEHPVSYIADPHNEAAFSSTEAIT
jgi:hypothetical protein